MPRHDHHSAVRTTGYTGFGYRHSIRDGDPLPPRPRRVSPVIDRVYPPSTFLHHEPCPQCGSRDNLARYDDGHAHCFTPTCNRYEPAKDVLASALPPKQRAGLPLLDGVPVDLIERRISSKICQLLSYWEGYLAGETVQIANYFTPERRLIAQKIRAPGKHFHWRGEPAKAVLFGQQAWRLSEPLTPWEIRQIQKGDDRPIPQPPKLIVVTEGEIDCLSVFQVHPWPTVSVPNGADSAASAVRKHFNWLDRFDSVVFLFDQDDAGPAAAHDCAALFSSRKARIGRLPLKDASEMLQAMKAGELKRAIDDAK